MSKFFIVSGSHDPYPKANAVCAKSIENALKNQGHEVIYVVTRNNITQSNIELINGNKVYFIPKAINDVHWSFSKMNDSFFVFSFEKLILKITHLFVKVTFRVLSFFRRKTSRDSAMDSYKHNFVEVMTKLLLHEKPDCVLSFSVPFTSHLFTYQSFLNSNYRPIWNCFLLDAHAQRAGISTKQKQLFELEETIIFNNADKCFLLNTLKEGYSKNYLKVIADRFNYFRLPFLKIPLKISVENNVGINKLKDTIDITFAGTLYDESRPIEYFCLFIKAAKGTKIRFHLMGKFYPKTLITLQKLKEFMPEQIFLYGFKTREFVLASLKSSDILINIGNNNSNQIPSKILEYIGFQKPIYSFIRDEKDAALEYLNLYKLSFVINENKDTPISEIFDHALAFYNNCKSEQLNITDLRNSFRGYLEEDVTSEIVQIIESQLDE
jgi:hypothetical protein